MLQSGIRLETNYTLPRLKVQVFLNLFRCVDKREVGLNIGGALGQPDKLAQSNYLFVVSICK